MEARKGDLSPMMWIIIGIMLLIAVIGVILVLRSRGFAYLDYMKGLFG